MRKRLSKSIIAGAFALTLMFGMAVSSLADTVTIKEDTVRVRSEASTSSNVVDNAAKDEEFKVLETVTGTDGNTWYKIQMNGDTVGYVRGDLVSKKQEASADTTANTATSAAPTVPTAISETPATVAGNSAVNIRSGAGTSYEKVASLDAGSSITLIGEANDAAGNKWYQFRCDSKGVEGYLRSDLITISQPIEPLPEESAEGEGEVAEEVPEQEEEPVVEEAPVGTDYSIEYITDDDGVYQYYLYDYTNNTRQKVTDLLGAISTLNDNYQKVNSKLTTFKVLAIAFGAVAVLAIAACVFLFLRSRDNDEVYYDYGDEEEEVEERPVRRQRPENVRPQAPAQRPQRPQMRENQGPTVQQSRPRPTQDPEERISRRPRRSQNFLADDDEFEFEFLNMDDKE